MTTTPPAGGLAAVPLLAGLDADTIRLLERESRVRRFSRGQVLCSEGDPGDELIVLEAGQVRVSRFAANGRETVLAETRAPASFGELALIDGSPRSATVTATTAVRVRFLGRQAVLDLIGREPEAALAMMRRMAAMIRATNERLGDLLSLDVPGRLAKWLLAGAGDDGQVTFEQSQESLARALGTTRESLNRALHRFERLGWIEVDGRRIRVLAPDALESVVTL